MSKGKGLLLFVLFLAASLASAGIAYALPIDINLNLTGTKYGHELVWKEKYSGTYDEFGGTVTENGIGYTVSKTTYSNVTAFNASTGELIWTTEIAKMDGTPLIDNQGNYIYINVYDSGSANGVYKLNKTDGSIIAENHTCSAGTVNSMAQNDNLIFDGGDDGKIYAYNKNDLTVNWSYAVPGANRIVSTPLFWEDTVTFGTWGGDYHFVQVNATTGQHIWNNTNFYGVWDIQPSIKDGIIYMGSNGFGAGGPAGAFNFSTGELIWNRTGTGGIFSQFAIYDNRVWFGGYSWVLYSLNLADGTTNCTFATGFHIYQGPSIVDGIAFIGSLDSYAYAINTTDCSLIWRYKTGDKIWSPPAVSKGMVYFKSDDTYVYAFDFGAGTGEWNYIGYDSSGQSYCSDCLTDWKHVKVNCTYSPSENATCSVTNKYNYATNVSLVYEHIGCIENWYNASDGTLLKSNSTNLSVEMSADSSTMIILELIDITPPNVIVVYPVNGSFYSSSSINFNLTVTDNIEISSCWYNLNNGTNYTMSNTTASAFNATNSSIADGTYTAKFYCNDTSNNINGTEQVTFTIDTTYPEINITSPLNQTYNARSIDFNVSANENLNFCKFTLTDWAYNYTMTLNASLTGANYTNSSMGDGSYTAKFWCNDTVGNVNNTEERSFTIKAPKIGLDLIWPTTSQVNVTQNEFFNVTVNVSCHDANCGGINVSLDPTCEDVDASQYCPVCSTDCDTSDGEYIERVQFYGIDLTSGDNDGYLDATSNISDILTPGENYTIYITESISGYDECFSVWFDWNQNQDFEGTERYDIGCGMDTIVSDDITVPVDAKAGSTMFRVMGEYDGYPSGPCTSPYYNEVEDYTACVGGADKGLINTTIGATPFYTNESNPRNISLNKDESQEVVFWVNATGEVDTTWEFFAYANLTSDMSISNITDTWNVTIISAEDTTPPQVNITSPLNQIYSVSNIDFNVSANENLSYCKFTIDDWANNYTMTEFNSTYFNYTNSSMEDGSYTAKFWCNDTSGNINDTESVNFTVDTTAPTISSFGCSPSSVYVGQTVTCSCSVTDATSGVETTSYTQYPSTSIIGTKTTTCTATDYAGNSNSASASFTVSIWPSGLPIVTLPSVSHRWDKIGPGAAVSMGIDKEGLDFTQIQLEVKNKVNDVRITVTKLAGQPATITQVVTGKVYQYMKIEKENIDDANIQTATINFRVNNTWISDNNIEKNMVALNRYANNQWNKLITTLVSENANYTYYSAATPGFSVFVITGEAAAAAQVCRPGAKRCLGDALQECSSDGSEWTTLEICQYGCDPTNLVCYSEPQPMCTPGEKRCVGDNLEQCLADGTGWTTIETCEYGCSVHECAEKPFDYIWILVAATALILAGIWAYWRFRVHS